jgi:UDP:flavonoid glycosyltransferase YjiC (YdhE family)
VELHLLLKELDMRILFSSMRLTGHIRPLLLYADALLDRGHDVVFSTPDSAGGLVRDAGLVHATANFPDEKDLVETWAAMAKMSGEDANFTAITQLFADLYARTALPSLRQTIASFKPDLIVRESMEFGSVVAAAETGVSVVRVATTNGVLEEQVLRWSIDPVDRLRSEAGLAPDQGAAMYAAPAFTSFPQSFEADLPASDMPTPFRVGGRRQTVPEDAPIPDWAKPDERPLVFVTLGTLAGVSKTAPTIMGHVLEAISILPARVLISTGPKFALDALGPVPDNATVVEWVPQEEIFPRVDALLCHGGAGTIIAAMTHGVPMVVTPMAADQPENARRIEAMGCGIALPETDAATIRAALERALSDLGLRATSDRVADEIAALPGFHDAAQELERLAG